MTHKFSLRLKMEKGKILSIFKEDDAPPDYVLVPVGDTGLSRAIRKRTIESGRNVLELKQLRSYKYSELVGNFVPSDVLEASTAQMTKSRERKQAKAAKLRAIESEREAKEKAQVDEEFRRQYPAIPVNTRDAIYAHAFLKGSGRVGTAEDLDLATKVRYATEYHVLYEMTPFNEEFEKKSDRLYAELEENKMGGMDGDYNYDIFYEKRDAAKERLKDKYFPEAIAITRTWKNRTLS